MAVCHRASPEEICPKSNPDYLSMQQRRVLWPNWSNGAFTTAGKGEIVDFDGLGGITGKAGDYARSGYCATIPNDPQQAMHITWFESQSDDAFILGGLGAQSSSVLVAEMVGRAGEDA
jgi:hypothetical protein